MPPPARRSPMPVVSVAHSPTPSAVRMAARCAGAGRNAAAACASWCPVNRIFVRGMPRCDEMMPRTQTFSPERVLDRVRKRSPRARKRAQRAGEDPLELQHAALVEDHRVEIRRARARLIEAPLDGAQRKARVVLAPRQPLLLHRRDRHAVDDERGGRVVVVRGDAENLHVRYWLVGESSRRAGNRLPAGGSRRSARLASHANGGSSDEVDAA